VLRQCLIDPEVESVLDWAEAFGGIACEAAGSRPRVRGNIIFRRMLATLITSAITAFVTALFTLLVQERKMRRDFRLEFMAEQAARELLSVEKWNLRSFDAIKLRLGGFEDNDLRKMLVRAGAVRFLGKSGEELWGLTNRNKHLLNKSD
jgi:hypothetical protein